MEGNGDERKWSKEGIGEWNEMEDGRKWGWKKMEDGRKRRMEGNGGRKDMEDGRKLRMEGNLMERDVIWKGKKHVKEYYFYKDLFTHKDIHTYINDVV